MPYRIDIAAPPPEAPDVLVELGALDVECGSNGLSAILPDSVTPAAVARLFGTGATVSPAVSRDGDSVWLLSPRPVRIGGIVIATPDAAAPPDALRLNDGSVFGTGHHPTTALCIEGLAEAVAIEPVNSVLDVGTGTGILALAALRMGVPQAVGIDIDDHALQIAAENARLNGLADRLRLVHGGPDAVTGVWPLVVANVLAAPLIEMAPLIVRRVASRGRLILSGVASSVQSDVREAYEHLGMWHSGSAERGGWVMLTARASW